MTDQEAAELVGIRPEAPAWARRPRFLVARVGYYDRGDGSADPVGRILVLEGYPALWAAVADGRVHVQSAVVTVGESGEGDTEHPARVCDYMPAPRH